MNTTFSSKPTFNGEHFVYGRPHWFEPAYRIVALLAGAALAYVALSLGNSFLTQALFLFSVISILVAISPRSEWSSVYFICNNDGVYFPSSKAQTIFTREKNVPWLLVPWRNISDIRNQLVLDEAANTQGIVFSIATTLEEKREFLSRLTISRYLIAQRTVPDNSFLVGFTSIFHRPDEVVSVLDYYRTAGSVEAICQ